jgi:uncharacterized protein (TIGR03790 family)
MKTPRGWIAVLALLLIRLPQACADGQPTPAPTRESAATLVVYNNLDPGSVELAAYYSRRRGIPFDHLVGLDCPVTEEISRAQYDETIAEPLRKIFTDNGWWHVPDGPNQPVSDNQIRFVALMRGIPLKIAGTANYPGDSFPGTQQALNTNAAAVDSELAVLGLRTRKISGPIKNFYYQSFTPFMDARIPPFMLVCRLDGPTVDIVKNMIDGAIAAETNGLNGFAYINLRGITTGGMAEGDRWLSGATLDLRKYGMPLVWDSSPALFPEDYPMDHVAVYLGWYSASVQGPMARDDFQFVPGAIAVHIHSFSGATLRDPHANWCAPLLAHGAAATLGNVYEPYLDLTPHLDIFADRLRNGFNFAESAYASVPAVSWMTTFVGDPLYRPFGDTDINTPDTGPDAEYAAFQEGARAWYGQGKAAGIKELQASARRLHSGIVWEGLGLLEWSIPANEAALESFREAQQCYGHTSDAVRTVLHQVEILGAEDKVGEGRALGKKAIAEYQGLHGVLLLQQMLGLSSTPSK